MFAKKELTAGAQRILCGIVVKRRSYERQEKMVLNQNWPLSTTGNGFYIYIYIYIVNEGISVRYLFTISQKGIETLKSSRMWRLRFGKR